MTTARRVAQIRRSSSSPSLAGLLVMMMMVMTMTGPALRAKSNTTSETHTRQTMMLDNDEEDDDDDQNNHQRLGMKRPNTWVGQLGAWLIYQKVLIWASANSKAFLQIGLRKAMAFINTNCCLPRPGRTRSPLREDNTEKGSWRHEHSKLSPKKITD